MSGWYAKICSKILLIYGKKSIVRTLENSLGGAAKNWKKGEKREKIMFTLGFEPTHREKSIFKSSALLTELQRLDYENIGQMSALLCIKLIKIALS